MVGEQSQGKELRELGWGGGMRAQCQVGQPKGFSLFQAARTRSLEAGGAKRDGGTLCVSGTGVLWAPRMEERILATQRPLLPSPKGDGLGESKPSLSCPDPSPAHQREELNHSWKVHLRGEEELTAVLEGW